MIQAERLVSIVAAYYGVSLDEMRRKRYSESVWLRAVAVQAAQRYPQITLSDLARVLCMNHTSVIYLRDRKVVRRREVGLEPDLLRLVAVGMPSRARLAPCDRCGGRGIVIVDAVAA